MGQRPWRILGIVLAAGLVLQGCPAGRKSMGSASPEVRVLYHGADCGLHSDAPLGVWIGGDSDLLRLGEGAGRLCEAGRDFLQDVDFDREGVLLLGLGMRRTGGYGIRLASPDLEVSGDTAMIRLHLLRPSPGARTIQVLTWPCVLLRVPRGDYRHVQAVDEAGRLVVKTRIR
ncbi:protease complex subunit PrcB family protein [Desulfobotulus sp.]|jgi:hypothetical protein|uniref:protease complex subunit PrcB family protein n=1 Tax=Desulfobotulus sp. TaxID=1940337 RepID=UPI002A365FEC|nr:protease complex subunit PrcB family protein [Desulfobotulus sp.]MDY0163286.1 protease complex subunit PrcB family protein [Desulfobotulus sp.]